MKTVKIKDFLIRKKTPVDIKDNGIYKRLTIKTKNQGVFLRDEEIGANIGTKKQFIACGGQFIVSKIDAMNGAFGIIPMDISEAIITGNFWVYDVDTSLVNVDWFNLFVSLPSFSKICESLSSGTTHRKYLDEKKFSEFQLRLPSIKEQVAAVERFNERKQITDCVLAEMEKQQKYAEMLRQSILQQAVEGKLCEQDPKDEPASVLLEKIKAEKEHLIAEKKIKKQKPLPPISEEEKPFALPKGWEWCRLGELLTDLKYGTSVPCSYEVSGVPVLRIPNINTERNCIDLNDLKFASLSAKETADLSLKNNDILLIRSNGSATLVGRFALVEDDYETLCYAGYLIRVRTLYVNNKYLNIISNARYFRQLIEVPIRTTTGVKNINASEVSRLLIALPPLQEQERIVAKFEVLNTLCNELEETVSNANKYASKLMETVLQEVFSVQETEKSAQVIEFHPDQMKPETELLAAARGKIREDTWEHLRKRALEIAGEES